MDFGRTPLTDVAERSPAGAVSLQALLAMSNEGFFYVGADAQVAFWSDAAASLSGIPASRAVDCDVRRLLIDGAAIVAIPFDGHPHELRVAVEAPDGLRTLRLTAIAVDTDAHAHGWFCSFGPERRYREIEQLKNEIVAAVSHELKTPIATIKAYADTLRQRPEAVVEQRDEFLRVIDEQADRLARAVDDLLLASRVDAEQLLKQRVTTTVDALLDKALHAIAFDESLHPVVRRTAHATVSGDPDLLTAVVAHLLDNARKFSPAGTSVTVEARSTATETALVIRDGGIGIAEEHLSYVFERFYRVENELTAPRGGSGLGLSIARSLVRAHGGSISVESRPGAGASFIVRLPARPA